ncbi:MAG: hypothetical protein ACK5MK_13645 [Dysgonomonas sp.]
MRNTKLIIVILAILAGCSTKLFSQIVTDGRKQELLQSIKPNQSFDHDFELKTLNPEIEMNRQMLRKGFQKKEIENKDLRPSINPMVSTFPSGYIPPNSLKNLFPQVSVDITYKGGFVSNRYNDPYFRWDGFSGLFFEDGPLFGPGVTVGGLNLHDPKSWFTRKKRKRIAENLRKITLWVYPAD